MWSRVIARYVKEIVWFQGGSMNLTVLTFSLILLLLTFLPVFGYKRENWSFWTGQIMICHDLWCFHGVYLLMSNSKIVFHFSDYRQRQNGIENWEWNAIPFSWWWDYFSKEIYMIKYPFGCTLLKSLSRLNIWIYKVFHSRAGIKKSVDQKNFGSAQYWINFLLFLTGTKL